MEKSLCITLKNNAAAFMCENEFFRFDFGSKMNQSQDVLENDVIFKNKALSVCVMHAYFVVLRVLIHIFMVILRENSLICQ